MIVYLITSKILTTSRSMCHTFTAVGFCECCPDRLEIGVNKVRLSGKELKSYNLFTDFFEKKLNRGSFSLMK